MAEIESKEQKSSISKKAEQKKTMEWKSIFTNLGAHILTGFISGMTLAAGAHAFQILVRGKQPETSVDNIIQLRRNG